MQVLFGEDFRRGHDASLKTVVECNEHRHQGHERLARAHIALQQAVHLSSATHVGADLVHHTLLCSRERKRQVVAIETVEDVPHTVEHVAPVFAAIVAGVAQNVELHVEELFKLQSQTGTLHLIGILGIVNPAECLGGGRRDEDG